MKISFRISFLCQIILSCSISKGLVPINDIFNPSVPFYKEPGSPFPSGTIDLLTLNETKLSAVNEVWYLISKAQNSQTEYWVPESNLYFLSPTNPLSLHQQNGLVKESTPSLKYNNGWRPGENIEPGTKITITSVRSDWSCGLDQRNNAICVKSSKVLLPIDLATKVKTKRGIWIEVVGRERHLFRTARNKLVPISKIVDFKIDKPIAFIKREPLNLFITQFPTLKSQRGTNDDANSVSNIFKTTSNNIYIRVIIKDKTVKQWNQSRLENHGAIWWQTPENKKIAAPPIVISTEELNSRLPNLKIVSQSSYPISIVSANGVFISHDKASWKYLSQFGETNLPVAIGPRNTIIVSDQISFNDGKNFQNYLRWDQVTLLSQNLLHHPPAQLVIKSIDPLNHNSFKVQIDTGYKTLSFAFNMVNSQLTLLGSRLNKQ